MRELQNFAIQILYESCQILLNDAFNLRNRYFTFLNSMYLSNNIDHFSKFYRIKCNLIIFMYICLLHYNLHEYHVFSYNYSQFIQSQFCDFRLK